MRINWTQAHAFRRCLLLALLSCFTTALAQEAKLAGTWTWTEGGVTLTLRLNADHTGSLNGDGFRYTVSGNRILVQDDAGDSDVYTYSLDGDALTVAGGSLPRALTFTRQLSSGGMFERGLGKSSGHSSSTGERNAGSNGLVGRWQSNTATVEVFDNGKLTINGEQFNYRVEGRYITLSNSEGSLRVEFQLNGDTLVTNYDGERTVYKRVSAATESGMGGGGANPPELFGKWCYMSNVNATNGGRMTNTCFTLYPNGTYEYYSETSSSNPYGGTASQESDSGTWSVSGSTLIANSRARGRQTFSLEKRNHPKTGDPMLVVDGDAFVTYSPRAPW